MSVTQDACPDQLLRPCLPNGGSVAARAAQLAMGLALIVLRSSSTAVKAPCSCPEQLFQKESGKAGGREKILGSIASYVDLLEMANVCLACCPTSVSTAASVPC